MLEKDERSHYVYENKGNKDKVPDEKTDICVDMTRLLQKKTAYDRESLSGSVLLEKLAMSCLAGVAKQHYQLTWA